MTLSIGQIEIDDVVVAKQLKIDFRDDWFPDPLGYREYFSGGLLTERLSANFNTNHGSYRPSQASLINVPKSNFTLRYALETSVLDRAIYHALAAELHHWYDPLISWRVFSHRRPPSGDEEEEGRKGERYLFRNGVRAWSDFLGCVQSVLIGDKILLSTDLANYFENINLAFLKERMIELIPSIICGAERKAAIRAQVDQLFSYISSWTYSTERGLPQNRDASSFLANIYMSSVDTVMVSHGYQYFRYMDDIKIVCDDQHAARKALKDLILALRPLGQSVNSGKTKLVSGLDADAVRDSLASGSPEMKRIDSAWQTKSLQPIKRTFVPLRHLALQTLRARQYDSREFRYCVPRLETLARCGEFAVPPAYFEEITDLIIDGLDVSPSATDQICSYLRSVPLSDVAVGRLSNHLLDQKRSLYNWKNYRLWLLLTQRGLVVPSLLELARSNVRDRGDDPTRAGASIYLGALGDSNDRLLIAERFHQLKSFLGQRSAIIGAHELHYAPRSGGGISIRDHVSPHLRDDLKGAYKVLGRKGEYFSPLEPVSISRFVDLERDYD